MTRACDVCGTGFTPASDDQRRCSEACRDFAQQHKHARSKALPALWRRSQESTQPCPSGKVRHQRKAGAEKSARQIGRQRFGGKPDWLRVYECDLCHGWHLTSKARP